MFKFKKKSNKFLLIGILVFNIFMLLSFLIFILIQYDLLPNSLVILTFPFELISNNTIIVITLLLLEGIVIGFSWFKSRKDSKINYKSDEDEVEFDFLLDDDKEETALNSHHSQLTKNDFSNIINEESNWNDNSSNIEIESNPQQIDISFEAIQGDNTILLDKEDVDISPGFLAINENMLSTDLDENYIIKKTKDTLTDQQFAIYQTIVSNEWFYERTDDRERIGFDNNAINESNITLSDLNLLLKSGLIYKLNISHPTGSFNVITSNPHIEKVIVETTLRRICRKKRIKTIKRKFDFQNWKEFGIAKRMWQFDIEIPQFAILVSIFSDNEYSTVNKNLHLKQETKEKLKALIAAASLKMKGEGKALIITKNKERKELIKQCIKNTGWGKVNILNFSTRDFISKFTNLLK